MPLISVVIPLYNKELHIKRAIDSVLAQKVRDLEIVIVDDGSTDKGAEIVKSYKDPKIRLLNQENAGVSAARNKGISVAKADIIAFLDADDEWMPNFLEIILNLREKYPNAGAYSTAYKICNQYGKMRDLSYKSIPKPPWEGLLENYFLTVDTDFPLSTSSIVVPIKILQEVEGFKIGYWWGEDDDMFGRIALKYSIAFSSQIGSIYYHNSENRACSKNIAVKEHPFVISGKNAIECDEVPAKMKNDLIEYISYLQIATSRNNLCANNRKESLKTLKSCKTNRHKKKKMIMILLSLTPYNIYNYIYYISSKLNKNE